MKNRIFVIFIFITSLTFSQKKECIIEGVKLSSKIDSQIKKGWEQDSNHRLRIIDYAQLATRNQNIEKVEYLGGSSRIYLNQNEKIKLKYQHTKKEEIDSGFRLTETEIQIYFTNNQATYVSFKIEISLNDSKNQQLFYQFCYPELKESFISEDYFSTKVIAKINQLLEDAEK